MQGELDLPSPDQLESDFEHYGLEYQNRLETYNAVMSEGVYEKVADNMYHGITTACFLYKPGENFQDEALMLTQRFYLQTDLMWEMALELKGEEAEQYKEIVDGLSLEGLAEFAHGNFVEFTKKSLKVDESPENKRKYKLVAQYWSGVDLVADIASSAEEESVA